MKQKQKAISPIVATILLVVVAVILVVIILSWGKDFTNKSLNKTNNIGQLKVSDATYFVYPKIVQGGGILQINYNPPQSLANENITITQYQLLDIPDSEIITLQSPVTLTNNGFSIIQLDCLYEHALNNPDFTVQLITDQNTYINVKLKDSGMVCSSSGTGTEEDPIVVCNADDLNAVRLNLDANYVLGKDIDLKCYSRRDENGWEPIGTLSSRFSGSFDGQNHIISNMYINRPTTTGIGFFSRTTKSSIIKNIGLKDANIYGGNYMGCLCGYNKGTVTNSYATGYIKATLSGAGHANIGGLVGVNDGGLIQDSYFEGNVLGYGAGSMVGGLIGQTVNGGRISNCFAKGSVYGVGDYVGGLSGANDCGGTVDCYIENCYADCSVVGLRTAVGGLVGATVTGTGAASVIKHSYSKGNVTGVNYVGGIVGYNIKGTFNSNYSFSNVHRSSGGNTGFGGFVGYNKSGKIINSYSIGTVSGNSWTPTDKGFSGLITTGGIYEDTNNFYDTETSLQTSTAGNALGKTTEEMKQQQTYVGWDFTNVWAIDPNKNNGYPYFKWQD